MPHQRERARAAGIVDLGRKYTMRDMASGDVIFAATGITDGSLLEGVRLSRNTIFTHSVVMRARDRHGALDQDRISRHRRARLSLPGGRANQLRLSA